MSLAVHTFPYHFGLDDVSGPEGLEDLDAVLLGGPDVLDSTGGQRRSPSPYLMMPEKSSVQGVEPTMTILSPASFGKRRITWAVTYSLETYTSIAYNRADFGDNIGGFLVKDRDCREL